MAGVGLGTVSRVVRGKGSVSPAKLERVQRAIDALGYRPSHAARSLLYGTSRMVGVYIPLLSGTFYAAVLQIIDAELRGAGLHMMVTFGRGREDARRQAVEGVGFLLDRGCDGVVVLTSPLVDDDLAAFGDRRGRLVGLNHSFDSIAGQCFTVDHRLGGRLAARALLDHAHRDIAVVAGPPDAADNVERMAGFMDELAAAGIDTDALWQAERDFSCAGGRSAAQELVASGRAFSAVFCANDEMALGALSYFHEAGIRVPADVSVVGYDDAPGAAYATPRLTSVHIPWREMTKSAVAALLNVCYDMHRPVTRTFPVSVSLRSTLVHAATPRPARAPRRRAPERKSRSASASA
jgi:LacI family transcriptional regulator